MGNAQNPWVWLPDRPPYILPEDLKHVAWHNRRFRPAVKIIRSSMPEPWVGDVRNAPVLVLSSNPGHDPSPSGDRRFFRKKRVKELIRENLDHKVRYLYHLYPWFKGYPGYKFWHSVLSTLIKDTSEKAVARCVAAVELHPYHSISFKFVRSVSQSYTRQLVLRAIHKNRVIVVPRRWDWWGCCVPELYDHGKVIRLELNGGVFVTPKKCVLGLCPVPRARPSTKAYNLILNAVRACAKAKGIPISKKLKAGKGKP